MVLNAKILGYLLIGVSIILLFVLVFVKMNIDKQGAFLCEYFNENQLNMEECPAHKSDISWAIVSAFGIASLIFGAGAYLLFMPKLSKEETKREFKQIDTSKLSDEEKMVYGIIRNKGGSAYQTDLIKETGFSKVKVTRVLDRLEMQGILERKRRGMTNIIVLK